MRVRCSSCGADYEAAVTRRGLARVPRCAACGRATLHPVNEASEPDDSHRERERPKHCPPPTAPS